MVAQLVEDLLHLERREDRLDQDGRADRALRHADGVLGVAEDVVPEARLEVALELRQVVVRAAAALDRRRPLWKRCRPKSKRLAETGSPSTRTCRSLRCQPRGRTTSVAIWSLQPVLLALGARELEVRRCAAWSVAWPCTTLAQDGESASSRSAMKTRAPELRALIAILGSAGPGDLAAPVVQVGRRRRHLPVAGAHLGGLGQEAGALAGERCARRAPGGAAAARRAAGRRCAAGRRPARGRRRTAPTRARRTVRSSTSTPATPATPRLPRRARPADAPAGRLPPTRAPAVPHQREAVGAGGLGGVDLAVEAVEVLGGQQPAALDAAGGSGASCAR